MKSVSLALVGAMALGLSAAVALRAQQSPTPQTFRAGTDIVRVEVSVLDKNRKPIRGLTAADFTIVEDGKPRPVVAFGAIDLPPVAVPRAKWMKDTVPDVATNTQPDEGRLVVILMDRSTPPGLPQVTARNIGKAAIDQLAPTDLAAVVYVGAGVPQNFTADHRLLTRAIDNGDPGSTVSADAAEEENNIFSEGGAPGYDPTAALGGLRQHDGCYCGLCAPESITRIADALRDATRRKSLFFVGADITLQSPVTSECAKPLKDARETMFAALRLSNVTIHSISPLGLETVAPSARAAAPVRGRAPATAVTEALDANLEHESSLHILPDYTGGRTVSNTNDPVGAVSEIFAESDAYYLLGFEPGDPHADARLRRIEIKVNRSGAKVRAREGYYVGVPETLPAAPDAPSAPLARALRGVLPDRGWPLVAAVMPIATSDLSLPVVLVALGVRQPVDLQAAPSAGGAVVASRTDRVEFFTNLLDRFARPRAGDHRAVDVTFDGTRQGDVQYELFSTVPARPGSYELRVAASIAGSSAQSGSVFAFVDVPNFAKDPLSMSGMALEASPARPSAPRDVVAALVPVLPTTARQFTSQDRVGAFVRVYQGGASMLQAVQVTARILDGADRGVFDQVTPFGSDRFAVSRSADYRLDLPLTQLSPGDYLLTVEATSADKHTTKRDIRFVVK